MGTDSETDLMVRFAKGDETAFRELFLLYRNRIIAYCYRFFFDRDLAEELSQEVFLKVYRAGPGYVPTARFSTWIFKIAANTCLNERRREIYRTRVDSMDSDEGLAAKNIVDRSADPHGRIEAMERKKRIGLALRDIPARQKAALLLKEYHGFSYREIGGQLNMTEAGVKSLIHRARESLRQTLWGELGEE